MMDLNNLKALATAAKAHSDTIGEDEWYTGTENMSIFAPSPDLSMIAALTPDVVLEWHALTERLQSELTAERAAKAQGAAPDERAAFELVEQNNSTNLTRQNDGQYENPCTQSAWEGWQARAALAPSIQALPVVAPEELSVTDIRSIMHNYSRMHQPGHYSDTEFDCLQDVIGFVRAIVVRVTPAAAQPEAKEAPVHDSDCALHNGPAYPVGPCDCSVSAKQAPAALSDEQISAIIREVAELPDRDSPTDQPDMMLVSADELRDILLAAAGNSQDAKDAARLDFIENCTVDLRCHDAPTPGGDDVDIYWNVIEHHMAEPHEREIGCGNTARQAIDAAMAAAPSPAEAAPAPAKEAP